MTPKPSIRIFLPIGFVLIVAVIFAQKKTTPITTKLNGKHVYTQNCMKCHQVDGAGAMNMIPPLIKSDWVLGSKAKLINVVLKGLHGEITVNGDIYGGEMPAQANLSNDEIVAVLTYVRTNFGNKASAVPSDEVKKMRSQKEIRL
jgi:mono/diheme cytochrome c family protein